MKHNYLFNFQRLDMIRYFGESIFNGKIILGKADKQQSNLSNPILYFNSKV